MVPSILEFRPGDEQATALALAGSMAARLADAIDARGVATLALSGGRSPTALFGALSKMPLTWDKLVVTQVDERWVASDHPDSNSALIRGTLLTGAARAARFLPMKNAAQDPYLGQVEFEAQLAQLPLPFDLVLLGMGEDGHTASLFPGAKELADGLSTRALSLAVTPPVAPHPRLSLSLRGLMDSRRMVLQINGAAKEAVYRKALAAGAVGDMPIRALLRQTEVPVEVWISA